MKNITISDKLEKKIRILTRYFDDTEENVIIKAIESYYRDHIRLNIKLSEEEILKILDMEFDDIRRK